VVDGVGRAEPGHREGDVKQVVRPPVEVDAVGERGHRPARGRHGGRGTGPDEGKRKQRSGDRSTHAASRWSWEIVGATVTMGRTPPAASFTGFSTSGPGAVIQRTARRLPKIATCA